jgi:uncharacterized membrane protein YfcA
MPFLLILIGIGAGILSGLFGIGGGIVIVPALIYLAKFPMKMATGTSLAVFLMPVGILGAMTYYRAGNMNIRATLWVALGLFMGAWFGARLAQVLTPVQLKRAFAVLLLFMAGRMLWDTRPGVKVASAKTPALAAAGAAVTGSEAPAKGDVTPDAPPGR